MDPQLRAVRAIAARNVANQPLAETGEEHSDSVSADPPGVGPVLLSVGEVSKLIGRSRSTIYQDEKNGTFPERIKLGSSARWKKSEVLAWVEEHAAKRGEH